MTAEEWADRFYDAGIEPIEIITAVMSEVRQETLREAIYCAEEMDANCAVHLLVKRLRKLAERKADK